MEKEYMNTKNLKRMSEEEYKSRIAELKKQQRIQEALDKVAEEHLAQRKPKGPVQPQRRPIPRRVIPQTPPIRGLLHVDDQPAVKGFMGLLATTPDGSKG